MRCWGRGVTKGIRADPRDCAYGSVWVSWTDEDVGFFEGGDIRPNLDVVHISNSADNLCKVSFIANYIYMVVFDPIQNHSNAMLYQKLVTS